MSHAIAILRHAMIMIFHDPRTTVWVLRPGLIFVFGAAAALYALAPDVARAMIGTETRQPAVSEAGTMLLGMLVMGVGFILIVIRWHRHVLLHENGGARGVSALIVAMYVWRSLLLGLIMFGVALVVYTPVGLLTASTAGTGAEPIVSLLGSACVAVVLGWVIMRLSLVLPAVAVEQPLGFADSWRSTDTMSVVVLWLSVILSFLNLVFTQTVGALVTESVLLSGLAQLVSSIFLTILGASVLTTLYGVLIEGRSLGQS